MYLERLSFDRFFVGGGGQWGMAPLDLPPLGPPVA